MQKTLGSLIISSLLLGTISFWPVGLGQADENTKIAPNLPNQNAPSSAVALVNNKANPYITRGEFAEKLVDQMDLNLDGYRFFKAPLVTDFFDDVSVDDSSANEIMILGYNGLIDTSDRKFRSTDILQREEMAQILANLLHHKGSTNMGSSNAFPAINDLGKANGDAVDDIKLLVSLGVMNLNKEGNFLPKQGVTPEELRASLKQLSSYIEVQDSDVMTKIITNKEGAREIELSWGEKPSSGYEINIVSLELEDNTMIVNYHTKEPDAGSYNSTVITEPKDSKPIPNNFPAQLTVKLNKI